MPTNSNLNDLPWLTLKGVAPDVGPHCVDFYEKGGELFMKVTLDGRNPGGGLREVSLRFSLDEADSLMQCIADRLRYLGRANVSV